jgi:hypothetical protein
MQTTLFTQYQTEEMLKKAIQQKIAQYQEEQDELEEYEEVEYK